MSIYTLISRNYCEYFTRETRKQLVSMNDLYLIYSAKHLNEITGSTKYQSRVFFY